jgi:diguanylate cyclase (GGDEF)-like protein
MTLRRRSISGRMIVVAAGVLAAGLATTFALRALSEQLITSEMQRRFTADAADASTSIGERLRAHAEVLMSMQGLYASVGRVDRAEFRRYVDVLDLPRRYPGFQALQSLRHVTAGDLESFLAEARSDRSVDPAGQPDFAVRPAGQRAAYDIVEFVEPMRGNAQMLGLDVGADPEERESLRRAAEADSIVATPPLWLQRENAGELGFVLRAPVYRTGLPVHTAVQRSAALRGFVASVYRMNDLMRGSLDARTLQHMRVRVSDLGFAKPARDGTMSGEPEDHGSLPTPMYDSLASTGEAAAPSENGVTADRAIVVGGRVWRLSFAARPGSVYEIDHRVPNLVLASGAAISLLMSVLAAIALRSRALAGSLSALDAEQRALLDNPLAGILFTEGRRILRGNRRVAELAGRSVDALAGSTIDALVTGDAETEKFDATLKRIHDSAIASEVELQLRRPDGTTVLIAAYGKPLASGEIFWVVQDKTEALRIEIERRAHAQALQAANAELSASLKAAEIRTREIALLSELSGMLQSCESLDEIYAAIRTYAPHLFPDQAGALYLLNAPRDKVLRGASWGALSADVAAFDPQQCWALRLGSPFPTSPASQGLVCSHACCADAAAGFVCLPLIAQNNLLGLLYREHGAEAAGDASTAQLAKMLAEKISLAIANLELREQLRAQAISDALTGLHNRRFLEDAVARETARSQREGTALTLALLDIDHFKGINDTHGHDGGDAVLRALGAVLRATTRASDIVGRFGGEEFMLLLPGVEIDAALARLNGVLEAVRAMRAPLPDGVLDTVTASIGVATMPLHAVTSEGLLAAADAALYRAKREGRNRVIAAPSLLGRTGTDG